MYIQKKNSIVHKKISDYISLSYDLVRRSRGSPQMKQKYPIFPSPVQDVVSCPPIFQKKAFKNSGQKKEMLNIQSEIRFFLKVPGAIIVLLHPVRFCRRSVFLRRLFKSDEWPVTRYPSVIARHPFRCLEHVLFDVLINGVL